MFIMLVGSGVGWGGGLPLHFCFIHGVSEIETIRVWHGKRKKIRGEIFALASVIIFFFNFFFLNSKKTFKKIKVKDCFTFVSLYDNTSPPVRTCCS